MRFSVTHGVGLFAATLTLLISLLPTTAKADVTKTQEQSGPCQDVLPNWTCRATFVRTERVGSTLYQVYMVEYYRCDENGCSSVPNRIAQEIYLVHLPVVPVGEGSGAAETGSPPPKTSSDKRMYRLKAWGVGVGGGLVGGFATLFTEGRPDTFVTWLFDTVLNTAALVEEEFGGHWVSDIADGIGHVQCAYDAGSLATGALISCPSVAAAMYYSGLAVDPPNYNYRELVTYAASPGVSDYDNDGSVSQLEAAYHGIVTQSEKLHAISAMMLDSLEKSQGAALEGDTAYVDMHAQIYYALYGASERESLALADSLEQLAATLESTGSNSVIAWETLNDLAAGLRNNAEIHALVDTISAHPSEAIEFFTNINFASLELYLPTQADLARDIALFLRTGDSTLWRWNLQNMFGVPPPVCSQPTDLLCTVGDNVVPIVVSGTTLRVGGSSNFSFDVGELETYYVQTGFEDLEKFGASTVTLVGEAQMDGSWNVLEGTLAVAGSGPSGAITDNAKVNVAAGAVFKVVASETIGQLTGFGMTTINSGQTLSVGSSENFMYGGQTSGGGGLTKRGTGTSTVNGNLGHSGLTTVAQGTLIVNGSIADTVFVQPGAVFGGNANIAGNLINLGTLSSGNSPGATIVGGDYFGGGLIDAEIQFDAASAPINGATHDFLSIGGNVFNTTLLNVVPLSLSDNPQATTGNGIELVRVSGDVSGSQFALATPVVLGGYEYVLTYLPDYSDSLDGFFLQSQVRQELWGNVALLEAAHTMVQACFRDHEGGTNGASAGRRIWAKFTSGDIETGGDTGVETEQDYSCGSGGIDVIADAEFRLGMSSGYGSSAGRIATPRGLARLDGDQAIIEGYAVYERDWASANMSLGYARTDWTFDSAHQNNSISVVSDGLVGSMQIAMRWSLNTSWRLGLLGAIDYDGTVCGDDCLLAGTSEEISPWIARSTIRFDGSLSGGRITPYVALSISDNFGSEHRVNLGSALVSSDATSKRFSTEAGFAALVGEQLQLFANVNLTKGLDNEVSGANGEGGFKAYW